MIFKDLLLHWPLLIFVLFCILVAARLFYFLYFFAKLAFYKQPLQTKFKTNSISVIVCARDEAANLAKNLPGILLQKYSTTHEVIVVDDNSYDDSKYLLEELYKEFKQLHIVSLSQEAKLIPGKKFPLAVGIKTAKHDIVLLTDADCVPATENWIQSMQSSFDDQTEIVLGYGPYTKNKTLLNKLIRWETFISALQYLSYALAGQTYMGVGRNLSYKKAIFFRHKGFSAHNHLPGGDDDLFINTAATKTNVKINIDPQSFTLSKPADGFKQWLRQKNRHYTTSKYYKPLHKILLGGFALQQFLFYPIFVVVAMFFSWQIALPIFGVQLILQAIIYHKTMRKLGESDLFFYFILFELWMMVYYILFAPALLLKPKQTWK